MRLPMLRHLALAAGLLLLATGPSRADTLTVFAAASLADAMGAAAAAWDGGAVTVAPAGSSKLARQIIEGAPADVFVAANARWMDAVAEAGRLVEGVVHVAGAFALAPGHAGEVAVQGGGGVPAIGPAQIELACQQAVAAAGVDHEVRPQRQSLATMLDGQHRAVADLEVHVAHARTLECAGTHLASALEQQGIEVGPPHLPGMGMPRFHGALETDARAVVIRIVRHEFRAVLAHADGVDALGHAQPLQQAHVVRQQRFADVETRMPAFFEQGYPPAALGHEGGQATAGRPAADDGQLDGPGQVRNAGCIRFPGRFVHECRCRNQPLIIHYGNLSQSRSRPVFRPGSPVFRNVIPSALADHPKLNSGGEIRMSSQQSPEEGALAELIVETLNLEDVTPEEIEPEKPLFGDEYGLDSIDALELALAISRTYGFQLKSDDERNREVFATLRSLSAHVEANRTQ